MASSWSPQRIRAEARAQAEDIVNLFVGLFSSPASRQAAQANYGVTVAEMDAALTELRDPATQEAIVRMFEEKLSSGAVLKQPLTQEEIADPYANPDVLARILRDTFQAFRDHVCGS